MNKETTRSATIDVIECELSLTLITVSQTSINSKT
jgi:hypothetical protein